MPTSSGRRGKSPGGCPYNLPARCKFRARRHLPLDLVVNDAAQPSTIFQTRLIHRLSSIGRVGARAAFLLCRTTWAFCTLRRLTLNILAAWVWETESRAIASADVLAWPMISSSSVSMLRRRAANTAPAIEDKILAPWRCGFSYS
jgi:hypothetical protein